MFVLTFPLNVQQDTGHVGIPKGATGRSGQSIAAICLHVLESTVETYLTYLRSTMALSDVRPETHGSMHYLVSTDGTLHSVVADTNTAWSIQGLSNPTWDLLDEHVGVNPNFYTLNIGVEKFISPSMPTLMFRGLADLVTFLCLQHNIPINANRIIDHSQLESTFDECAPALATNLIATVTSLAAQGNQQITYDIGVIAAQVAALDTRLGNLEDSVEDSLETIETYASHVTTVAGASTLGHVKASSTIAVDGTTAVASVKTLAAAYKIASGTQTIAPNTIAVIQFPTVVSDLSPAWVTLGAFWKVTPPVTGLYQLRAQIQFEAATWTAGNFLRMDVYKNGTLLETIARRVIEANLTSKTMSLQGGCQFVVETVTDYYDVRVETEDANGLKTIVGGNIVLEKIGA